MVTKFLKISLAYMIFSIFSNSPVHAQNNDALIDAAVANPNRMEANKVRDPLRKPGEVIKFMGVGPGDTVLDMVSNGGYYAEILAGVVGKNGRVIAHSFQNAGMDPDNAYAKYIRDTPHMSNVVPIYASFNSLDLKENSLDYVFLIQNFHDFSVRLHVGLSSGSRHRLGIDIETPGEAAPTLTRRNSSNTSGQIHGHQRALP